MGTSEDAGFLFGEISAGEIAFRGNLSAIGIDFFFLVRRGEPIHKRMLGGQHHIGSAVKRIGPGGVDTQHLVAGFIGKAAAVPSGFPVLESGVEISGFLITDEEIHLGSDAATNPVALE